MSGINGLFPVKINLKGEGVKVPWEAERLPLNLSYTHTDTHTLQSAVNSEQVRSIRRAEPSRSPFLSL